MKRDIRSLRRTEFDVVVIGAGITGAWIACDCARRGLSVALIDKGDFGAATSAKSSKILHGGIRYLQQLKLTKVRESALERARYHIVAPHLSHFVPFLVPTYRSLSKGKAFMKAGMLAYEWLCAGLNRLVSDPAKKVPSSYSLSRDEVLAHVPIADADLTGGVVFYESHMESSERMTLAVAESALRSGAIVANYVRADGYLQQNNRVVGVKALDLDTNTELEIRGQLTVNAAGPWISALNSRLRESKSKRMTTGFSKGSHVVTRTLIKDYAIALSTSFQGENIVDRGGRHIFIIPWRGHSLIGTSYVSAENKLDDLSISSEEIEQLLGQVNRALPQLNLEIEDILYSYSGIYPLQEVEINSTVYQGTGDYQLVDHFASENRQGLITALGAKYTTARLLAEKTTNLVVRNLGRTARRCDTHARPVAGGEIDDLIHYTRDLALKYQGILETDVVHYLVRQYGTDIEKLHSRIQADRRMARRLTFDQPTIAAQIQYAVDEEMAIRLEDVILRRTGLGTVGIPGQECLEDCAEIMGQSLGWSQEKRQQEVGAMLRSNASSNVYLSAGNGSHG